VASRRRGRASTRQDLDRAEEAPGLPLELLDLGVVDVAGQASEIDHSLE
jgi:hypothetical protein